MREQEQQQEKKTEEKWYSYIENQTKKDDTIVFELGTL